MSWIICQRRLQTVGRFRQQRRRRGMFVAMNVIIIPHAPEERHVPDDFAPTGLADLVNARAINIPPLTGLRTDIRTLRVWGLRRKHEF